MQQAAADLFRDADRHGPRWPALLRRVLPALVLLGVVFALACIEPWRELLIGAATGPSMADALLVAPVLAAIVVCAAAAAPLARIRFEPLLGSALVLLGVATWLTSLGQLAAATLPATFGALCAGIAAARAVRRAVWTLPLLLTAGISDASSVNGGITRQLLEDSGTDTNVEAAGMSATPALTIPADAVAGLDLLVLHVPAATGTWMLGLVDVLALGMLLGLAHLFWLPLPRTALALALALVLTIGLGVPVPVLPMLGLAWLAVHARLVWRATRFSLRRLTYLGG